MPQGGENQAYGLGSGQPPAEVPQRAKSKDIADQLMQGSADATALRGVQQILLPLYPLEPATTSAGVLAALVSDELPRLRQAMTELAAYRKMTVQRFVGDWVNTNEGQVSQEEIEEYERQMYRSFDRQHPTIARAIKTAGYDGPVDRVTDGGRA